MYSNNSPYMSSSLGIRNKNQNFIEVIGEGTVSAIPDQVQIILGVMTEDKNVIDTQQQNAVITESVINSLHQLGIPNTNIQTSDYLIIPQYNHEDQQQILVGYRVQHSLKVVINNIEKIGLVIDTAVQQGVNVVSAISFMVKQPEIYYNQALQRALKNGSQKAKTIAGSLGVELSHIPSQVTEITQTPVPFQAKSLLFAQAATTPIEPGQLQISAAVQIRFSHL